jgi:hypothetical protein
MDRQVIYNIITEFLKKSYDMRCIGCYNVGCTQCRIHMTDTYKIFSEHTCKDCESDSTESKLCCVCRQMLPLNKRLHTISIATASRLMKFQFSVCDDDCKLLLGESAKLQEYTLRKWCAGCQKRSRSITCTECGTGYCDKRCRKQHKRDHRRECEIIKMAKVM